MGAGHAHGVPAHRKLGLDLGCGAHVYRQQRLPSLWLLYGSESAQPIPAVHTATIGFEILAAALNAILLFLVAIYILYEAYRRFRTPAPIDSPTMLAIATIGLVVNLTSMRILRAGKDDNMNVKGAGLEVWSDMLGSAGVIVGAPVIRWTCMPRAEPSACKETTLY